MDATGRASGTTSAAEIRLEGISKVFADGTVGVAELDLTFAAGELTVSVAGVLPLEQAPEGLGRLATGGAGGKLVVTVED